jgi:phytoene synthase
MDVEEVDALNRDRAHGGPELPETAAIRHCEDVTRREARNFWYGIRLLPATKRRAMAAVYAMARRIDDIGDGGLRAAEKADALEEVCASLKMPDPAAADPVIAALGQAQDVCRLPLDAFGSLVRGVRMDLDGTTYRSITDLVQYCRCVAGSIGRLSLAVFSIGDDRLPDGAERLADDLGVALQLTNILRDVQEDREMGRLYLPLDDIERFGLTAERLDSPPEAAAALVRFEAERARVWFESGLRLLPSLDGRSAACVGAMAGIYRRLLYRIERDPVAVFHGRVSLSRREKLLVAARALAGAEA